MINNSLKVSFVPKNKDIESKIPYPKPSKFYIPKWFKDMPPTVSNQHRGFSGTAKKCMPFLDSLTSGYTQELACDIEIKYHGVDETSGNDIVEYLWAGNERPMSSRMAESGANNSLPSFPGFYNSEQHWNTFWEPKTPKGYSTLYYHPANRFDLPFVTMNGIIDTDNWSSSGPVPFLLKRGFEGIIPAGTPIYQMIFIKRDVWNSSAEEYNEIESNKLEYSVRRFFEGGYKKQYWSKKDYL